MQSPTQNLGIKAQTYFFEFSVLKEHNKIKLLDQFCKNNLLLPTHVSDSTILPFWSDYTVEIQWVSCHRAIVPSWVRNFFPFVFCGSKIFLEVVSWVWNFFSWVFRGSKIFLVRVSWVRNFFSWVFRDSEIFCCGHFEGPRFFPMGISWVQNFFSWVFRGSKILWISINFSKKQKETYDWGILTKSFK